MNISLPALKITIFSNLWYKTEDVVKNGVKGRGKCNCEPSAKSVVPNTISGSHFMRKRPLANTNGGMENYRDPTVTQSLLTGQSLVIRRETTTSDDMIVFSDR